jgi:hypothetical protein
METGMATKAPWCAVTATVEVIGGRWKPTIPPDAAVTFLIQSGGGPHGAHG